MTPRQVIARNHVEDSENRMHSDEVARRYGFRGGLVAGVTVYGYLTWPLTQRFGEHALQQAIHAVRLIKPAYDGETLRVEMEQASEGLRARSWNTAGDLLAELDTFIEQVIHPLEQQDDNIRFFDHRREHARTDWDNGGLPRADWEALLAEAKRRADEIGRASCRERV